MEGADEFEAARQQFVALLGIGRVAGERIASPAVQWNSPVVNGSAAEAVALTRNRAIRSAGLRPGALRGVVLI